MEPVNAYARLNARILPLDRGEKYEEPLEEALAKHGLGEVTGGGTMHAESGEIDFCGIDIDLTDISKGVPFVCDFLSQCGAPKGSKLEFESDGKKTEVPFGTAEGIAVYLNGTDLPDEVYRDCDVNFVYSEINRLLGERGAIQGYWQGPTETALYLYGNLANEMRGLIAGFIAQYPLCQRARIVQIA
jgi:hypothetical protein